MIKVTGVCHLYNEEYLLPYWIDHHKKIFDDIIFIDYASTDQSVNIIKNLIPNANIIPSRNSEFSAKDCDTEVIELEWATPGHKIALNITEFLVGNVRKMIATNDFVQYLMPAYPMVDSITTEFTELEFPNESLVAQRMNGINIERGEQFFNIRKARSLHVTVPYYPTGRHYTKYNTDDCVILWYGYSPFNEDTIKRKLQIQTRIPDFDRQQEKGIEHFVTRDQLIYNFRYYQQHAEDLTEFLYPKLEDTYNG